MRPGERIGPFVLEREIGRGGSGVVFAARLGDRDVALKIPIEDLSERDRDRFLEEATLVARLRHPAIVELVDSGTLPDGRPFLAMELLVGEPLVARVARGPMPPDAAIELFLPLAEAVAHLHEEGLVHRDIKAENVMLVDEGRRLVLLDFGIAREAHRPPSTTTQSNMVRGTPATMAPERFFGSRATAASDVYELAVVLYGMLTGRLPWNEAADAQARLFPKRPDEVGVRVPRPLADAVMEALSTRVEKRPSARELMERVAAATGAPLSMRSELRETAALPAQKPNDTPRVMLAASEAPPAKRRSPLAVFAIAIPVVASLFGAAWLARARHASEPHASSTAPPEAAPPPESPSPPPAPSADTTAAPSASELASAAPSASASNASRAPSPSKPTVVSASATAAAPSLPGSPVSAPAPSTAATPLVPAIAGVPAGDPAMPSCAKLVALYCSPQARASFNGEAMCASVKAQEASFAGAPSDRRAKEDGRCKLVIPGVAQAFKEKFATMNADGTPKAGAKTP